MSAVSELTHSVLFDLVHSTPDRKWFGMGDVTGRSVRNIKLFYYLLLTNPIKLTKYSLQYNTLWYGKPLGLLMTAALPVEPFVYFAVETIKTIKGWIGTQNSFDSDSVFFVPPKGPVKTLIWNFLKEFSVYTTGFMICRDENGSVSSDAIGHTWYDTLMDKYFWRKLLSDAGANTPRELGRWKDNKMEAFYPIDTDVVIKLPDSYLGIGDKFLILGTDFNTQDDIIDILKKEYADTEALVLEFVRPAKGMEVHQLDILTINSADEGVKCFNVIYWGGCKDGLSSHSTTEGYLVDVETETITGKAAWYSQYFADMSATKIGLKIPGLKQAVAVCIEAHKAHPYKWCRVTGWDCMITNRGPVFFEGNIAAHRTPRRVMLGQKNPWAFAKAFGL